MYDEFYNLISAHCLVVQLTHGLGYNHIQFELTAVLKNLFMVQIIMYPTIAYISYLKEHG